MSYCLTFLCHELYVINYQNMTAVHESTVGELIRVMKKN